MKSVVALLVLVAVVHAQTVANFQKDGGLKGSWDDVIPFETTLDEDAPGIAYETTYDFWTSWTERNFTDNTAEYWTYNYCRFSVTGEDRFYEAGGYSVSIWMGGTVDDPMVTVEPYSCSKYSDDTIQCSFYIYANMMTGSLKPMITLWDEVGNWAVYDDTDFTDVARPAVLTYIDNTPDVTAPTLATATVSDTTVVLPTGTDYSDAAYVDISVVVDDHAEGTGADERASGVKGAWVVIADEDGDEMSYMMYLDTYGTDSTETHALRFAFPNYAMLGTWNVARITASDNAGNWAGTDGAGLPVDTDVVVSWNEDNEDEVTSCQTLTFEDSISSLAVDSFGYAYAYFTLGCTEKYEGSNYAYISFQSPEYIPAGDTQKSSMVISSYGYYGLQDVVTTDVDYSYSFSVPGIVMTSGVAISYVQAYEGYAGSDLGDWTLYEVITVTDSGAAQRYTSDEGAASAVVPSVFAVLIAAVVAMLRL